MFSWQACCNFFNCFQEKNDSKDEELFRVLTESEPVRRRNVRLLGNSHKFSSQKSRSIIEERKKALNGVIKYKHSGVVHLVSIKESKEQFFAVNEDVVESPQLDYARSSSLES